MIFHYIRRCIQTDRWPEGWSPSPVERLILAAITHLGDEMKTVQDTLGRAAQTEAAIEDEVSTLLTEVTNEQQVISDAVTAAVAKALADAGVDQAAQDAATEAAADALAGKLDALHDRLTAALTPTPVADLPPTPVEPPNPPAPEPEPVVVTISPTSITGTAGTPVSGNFSATGQAPFTFVQDGALGDFTVTPDGFYAMNPTSPMTGSVNVTATDANGVASDPTSVSISIN